MQIAQALAAGSGVIVDDVNATAEIVALWEALAAEMGAEIREERLDTDPETCLARNARRPPIGPDGLVTGRRVDEAVIRWSPPGSPPISRALWLHPPRRPTRSRSPGKRR
jgi:predicted kinase